MRFGCINSVDIVCSFIFGLVGLVLFACLIVDLCLFSLVFAIVDLVFGLDCCAVVFCNYVVSGGIFQVCCFR